MKKSKNGTVYLLMYQFYFKALPILGAEDCAGRALETYLKNNKKWQQLKADAEAVSEVLVPCTFRHR